jgi:hypothetical protein
MSTQSIMQLFGPVQSNGCISQVPPDDWWFPETVVSASTKQLRCDYRLNFLLACKWNVVCIPSGNSIRLVHFDDGPSNITEIAQVTSPSTSAVTLSAWIELNGLISAGKYKQIGYQIKKGPSANELAILDVHLNM